MIYGSVCSGIEAASVAWRGLGWQAAWFAEIEPFPCAVLAHHYPNVPNLGDMTKIAKRVLQGKVAAPDVLVGGTPCQAYSVAGLREGLDDPRGQLTLSYMRLADAIDFIRRRNNEPESIIVWENVPGVLSDKTNAFGCFLAGLAGENCELQPPRGKWSNAGCVFGPARTVAWRVLDAQYFGLAQRRRRVFVVASARNGFDPAAVLFERDGVRRDFAPSRAERESITHPTAPCLTSSGRGVERGGDTRGQDPVVAVLRGISDYGDGLPSLRSSGGDAAGGSEALVAGTLEASAGRSRGAGTPPAILTPVICMAHGQGGAEIANERSPTLTCNHEAPIVVHGTQDPCVSSDTAFALGRNNGDENVIAFSCKDNGADASAITPTLRAMNSITSNQNAGGQVAVCIALQDTSGRDKAQNGKGWSDDGSSYTLDAAATQGVALSVALRGCEGGATAELGDDVAGTLRASQGGGDKPHVLAFAENSRAELRYENGDGSITGTISTGGGKAGQGTPSIQVGMAVRRLTPRECERLQGFPDDWTLIPIGRVVRMKKLEQDWIKYLLRGGVMTLEQVGRAAADGPRYKALGNSMAVPVMSWLGKRIQKELEV